MCKITAAPVLMCKKRVSEGTEGKGPLVVMSSTDVVHLQEKCESCVPRDELGDDVVLAAT